MDTDDTLQKNGDINSSFNSYRKSKIDPNVMEVMEILATPKDIMVPKTSSDTEIQKFYSGKNVFITGATGFLGKCLVEKLLWSCPDIGNLYLLMREKKGKDSNIRLDDLLDSAAFTRLKTKLHYFKSKIKVVTGDCKISGLGISTQDRAELLKEVNIVFHVAATVKFHEPLNDALTLNVRAIMDIFELSKEMSNLKAFVHVSTAYCHCYNLNLDERFYDTPTDASKLLNFVETLDQKIINDISPKLLGKWPNTYSFSKALAEDYLKQNGAGMPLGIFRPSIIISSDKEPMPKWVDNWYGLSGYVTACAAGLLRVMRGDKYSEANVVPVDMCVNGLIASAWDTAERYKEIQGVSSSSYRDIRIYNFVLANNPIKWHEIYSIATLGGKKAPPMSAIWYRCLIINSNKYVHSFNKFFLHWIPAVIFDIAAICTGNRPQICKMYNRIHTMEDVTTYFTTHEWNFTNHNIHKLLEKMSEDDRQLFSCDVRNIDWHTYLENYFLGVRRYLLKDDDSTIPRAHVRYNRLYWLHRFVQLISFIFILRGAYKTGRFLERLFNRYAKVAPRLYQ